MRNQPSIEAYRNFRFRNTPETLRYFYHLCFKIILFSFCGIPNSFSQVHTIFIDDTAFYITPLFYSPITFDVEFKDSLDDGLWMMYDLYKKDSLKTNKSYLIMTGTFRNKKREGVFNYYARRYFYDQRKKKGKYPSEMYVQYSKSYKNGLLDGMYFYNPGHGIVEEIMYVKGKKEGINVVYNPWGKTSSNIFYVNYYEKDTLISWREYNDQYKNILVGSGIRNGEGNYTYVMYYEDGSVEFILHFHNYVLYKYEMYHLNQVIKAEAEGKFADIFFKERLQNFGNPYTSFPYRFDFNIEGFELIKGVERRYNEKGELIYECKM